MNNQTNFLKHTKIIIAFTLVLLCLFTFKTLSAEAVSFYVSTDVQFEAALNSPGVSEIIIMSNIITSSTRVIQNGRPILLISALGGPYTISADFNGTAIYVEENATLIIGSAIDADDGVIITHESGRNGRGISIDGSVIMNDGEICYNNINDYHGGGVYIWGDYPGVSFTMNGGKIHHNSAEYSGGGVYNESLFTMNGGEIFENTAEWDGGGVHNENGTFTIGNGEISNNIANGNGGGVYNKGNNAIFTMISGSVNNNTAEHGGGIYLENSSKTIEISAAEIFENEALDGHGGGIFSNTPKLNLDRVNIYANKASSGAGLYLNYIPTTTTEITHIFGGKIESNISTVHGGGIYNKSNLYIADAVIQNNESEYGGGMYVEKDSGNINMGSTEFIGNNALKNGGGIFTNDFSKLNILNPNCAFSDNSAEFASSRNPANNLVYSTNINSLTTWTTPFVQGYNNYDINQVYDWQFRLTYDTNGGTPAIDDEFVEYRSFISSAAGYGTPPTLADHDFGGWYLDPTLDTPVGSTPMGDADRTIYAKWLAHGTLTYETNGGTPAISSHILDPRELISSTTGYGTTLTLDDHDFDGWYLDELFENPVDDTLMGLADRTIYAKWLAHGTLTYETNGGTPAISPHILNPRAMINSTAGYNTTLVLANHDFNGWYLDRQLATPVGDTLMGYPNRTIYAKWTAHATLSYQSNGGSPVSSNIVRPEALINTAVGYNTIPVRDGYLFCGWYLDAALTQSAGNIPMGYNNRTLYASWYHNVQGEPRNSDNNTFILPNIYVNANIQDTRPAEPSNIYPEQSVVPQVQPSVTDDYIPSPSFPDYIPEVPAQIENPKTIDESSANILIILIIITSIMTTFVFEKIKRNH